VITCIQQMEHGLALSALPVLHHDFTEKLEAEDESREESTLLEDEEDSQQEGYSEDGERESF